MQTSEITIYGDTTLSDILRESHEVSSQKREQILQMVMQLTPFIRNSSDAAVLGPVIKELLDVSVKNDDQLIKIAQVVQRLVSSTSKGSSNSNDNFLSPEELQQLLSDVTPTIDSLRNNKVIELPPASEKINKYLQEKYVNEEGM